MTNVLLIVVKWLARRLLWLLVIIAILIIPRLYPNDVALFKAELKRFVPNADLLQTLEKGKENLETLQRQRTNEVIRQYDAAGAWSDAYIENTIVHVTKDIADRESKSLSDTELLLAFLSGQGFVSDLSNDIEIRLLGKELEALRLVRNRPIGFENVPTARRRLHEAWLEHVGIYYQLQKSKKQRDDYIHAHPWWRVFPAQFSQVMKLNDRVDELLVANQRAKATYDKAYKNWLESKRAADALKAVASDVFSELDNNVLQPLTDFISARRRLDNLASAIKATILPALGILIGLVLVPIAIRAFFYFIVAPVASRRPPIRLLPAAAESSLRAESSRGGDSGTLAVASAVSQKVSVGEHHELLIHPEYIKGTLNLGDKDTKLLLDWRYPLSSLASGMVALTRIRGTSAECIVWISDRTDPFSEIGVITLPEGAALAFQPHNLVGVAQLRNRPIMITRHWRLTSLSAWLTLQLRYLVFHGPATLIVKGCRGIRVEQAAHGRGIDQAATIGFSANLAYSTTRCETFGAYLMGMHGLFNDNFSGGPGYYVYEEMPYFGKKGGVTGRGLEGVTDALLKVFGI